MMEMNTIEVAKLFKVKKFVLICLLAAREHTSHC